MHKSLYVFATAATLGLAGSAQAMPMTGGAMRDAIDATNLVEQTAVYVVEGSRYCFYFNGWHGPGWYRCGFAFRRGLGWGGVYGWQGWEYGPAARRFSHRGGIREGDYRREGGSRRDGVTVRERSTIREGSTVREGGTTRSRQGTTVQEGATVRGGAEMRGQTSGKGAEGGGRSGTEGSGRAGASGGGQMNVSPRGGDGGGGGGGGGGAGGGGGQGQGQGKGDQR
jgi:hypothetical protein